MHKLATTTNESAVGVLESAIDGPSLGVRRAAITAFGRRRDKTSQHRFVMRFRDFRQEELAELTELPRDFRRTLLEILDRGDPVACEAACHLLVHFAAYDELPTLVIAAARSGHPWGSGLAATALQLARRLHADVAQYQEHPRGHDPSFSRHWASNALTRAVDCFADHGRVELVDAFLLVATRDNSTLRRILSDTQHACHNTLLDSLRTSHSSGAVELLAMFFQDSTAPIEILELAAHRSDPRFRSEFLTAIGYPASPRALEGAGRVRSIEWLNKPDEQLLELRAEQQATAVQLATASRKARRDKVAFIDYLLAHGAPLARITACECLADIDCPEALTRLEQSLDDADPMLVSAAAKILRRRGNIAAVPRLAALLDHQHLAVRNSAQQALRDFTFIKYLSDFESFDPSAQRELGRIIVRTDPSSIELLRLEIIGATIQRKVRGLAMAVAMGVVDKVLPDVLKLAEHKDLEIRCDALTTLAESRQEVAREAIVAATGDPNASVRNRANDALQRFDSRQSEGGKNV